MPDSNKPDLVDPYELASRLSYFLWSSAPDDALLDAAGGDSLGDDEKIVAAVDRMLADAKATRFIENFSGQWLGSRKLPEHAASTAVYPDWSPQLADSMAKEMYLYFGEFLKSDRSWLDFMKADFNFVDGPLAKHYGFKGNVVGSRQRVEIRDDTRFGFAGPVGFLAMSSLGQRTSPTLRGRWILSNLLCVEPPPPPEGVAALSAGVGADENIRTALERHRSAPACAGCHALFDPYGLSLEQFDGVGKYRTTYPDGSRIDASAQLLPSDEQQRRPGVA